MKRKTELQLQLRHMPTDSLGAKILKDVVVEGTLKLAYLYPCLEVLCESSGMRVLSTELACFISPPNAQTFQLPLFLWRYRGR